MNAPDQNDIDAARDAAKGAKLFQTEVTVDEETIYAIFSKPKREEFHRYLDAIGTKDAKTAAITRAQETFIKSCLLWPSPAEMSKLCGEHYTLAMKLADEVFKVAAGEAKAATQGL